MVVHSAPEGRSIPTEGEATLETIWSDIADAPRDGTWIKAWRKPPSWTGPRWEPLIYVRWDEEEMAWVWPDEMYEVFTVRGRELADMKIADQEYFSDHRFTHWTPVETTPSAGTQRSEVNPSNTDRQGEKG